jgi:chromosomal replication initiator protein
VKNNFFERINQLIGGLAGDGPPRVSLEIGSSSQISRPRIASDLRPAAARDRKPAIQPNDFVTNLNPAFTFENFVEGKSNQLAKAAAMQVATHPGTAYNPLFIYGGVGLGKTHLMHGIGNCMVAQNARAHVVYLHSERFVADMV